MFLILHKLFDFVSIDPDKCTRGITNKTRIANAFTDAIKDLANMNSNLCIRSKMEKRGICKLKFIAGTYCCKSYRSSMNNFNKLQREKRHQLYIKQKWNDRFHDDFHTWSFSILPFSIFYYCSHQNGNFTIHLRI